MSSVAHSSTSHSASTRSSVTLNDVSFAWPDGTPALSGLTGSFGSGRTGLVGTNGTGKSTLLRLLAGRLTPASGQIVTSGDVGYLPQTLTVDAANTVAGLLGIRDKLDALHAIESGDVDERHFDTLGDDWDLEARADEALRAIGLAAADLDRSVAGLSGGEAMLVAITGLRLQRTAITLLDEPTNNLDRAARASLRDLVRGWHGTLIVVSHDTALLECMDATAELYGGRLSVFGGPYGEWLEHRHQEQSAAAQAVRTAEQAVRAEKRQKAEAETTLARRARTAQKNYENRTAAKIVMNQKASNAQVAAGKLRSGSDERLKAATSALDAAEARLRTDEAIHLELPDPAVPRGKRIAELHSGELRRGDMSRGDSANVDGADTGSRETFYLQGPERVAIIGANGVGKTTLLEQLVSGSAAPADRASGILHTNRVGYLSQRLDGLDGASDSIDNIRSVAPNVEPGVIRNRLARLLLRGDSVHRAVHTLSGGERFRVALARLLFTEPPPQLLVLDEPTNNLDLQSVDQLIAALLSYRGAVLIVSHDDAFLDRIGLDRILELNANGGLRELRDRREA